MHILINALLFLAVVGSLAARSKPYSLTLHQSVSTRSTTGATVGWQYEKTTGASGASIHKATVASSNVIEFPFPYQGGSKIMLTLRNSSGDTYAYLEVDKGLFTKSFQNGSAQVTFDAGRPVTYSLSAAANGRANIVFFERAESLIQQLKKAKTILVKLRFAGQPAREIRFATAGLRWSNA